MNKKIIITCLVTAVVLALFLLVAFWIKKSHFFPLDSTMLNVVLVAVYISLLYFITDEFSSWVYAKLNNTENNQQDPNH